jgi:hypothetical protein
MSRVIVAVLAVLASAAFIAINVVRTYHGNVSGAFYTGTGTLLPPSLEAEPTWRVADPKGYDAQFYHLVLHDPLLRSGYQAYADNARLRFRRIGVPGLAAAIHAGSGINAHWAYVLVQLAFVFLWTWWLAAYAQSLGLPALVGWGFLAIPAVLVSLDRMTVDLPLAALTIGLLLYGAKNDHTSRWKLFAILCLAPLVRETGMLLVAGWCVWSAIQRRWKEVVMGAICAAPAIAWWVYVQSRTPPDSTQWLARYPFSGLVDQLLAGTSTPATTLWLRMAGVTEHLAFAGIVLSIVCCLLLVWRKRFGLPEITAILFAAFVSLLGRGDIWDSAYATGRTMSPLLIVLALIGIRNRQFLLVLPMLLVLPRILLQFEAQILAAIRAA